MSYRTFACTRLCVWKTWPCDTSWPSINKASSGPNLGHLIAFSGLGCPACGQTGNGRWIRSTSDRLAWQKKRFRDYWRQLSHSGQIGRPAISKDVGDLIRDMWRSNPTWGSPRIVGELRKLGITVAKSTVEKYRPHVCKPSSPTWKAFLNNHLHDIVACDFFIVPTASFKVLFVFILLAHERRRIVHFNVTEHPTAIWTAQQIVEAFPWDTAPRYLLRDQDSVYSVTFQHRIKNIGMEEVKSAPRSPWQNPYCERLIGSIRRDVLDHVIILNDQHLRRVLTGISPITTDIVPIFPSIWIVLNRERSSRRKQARWWPGLKWEACIITMSGKLHNKRWGSSPSVYRESRTKGCDGCDGCDVGRLSPEHPLECAKEHGMSLRIELPDDLVRELEQEVARQELSLAEVIREALHIWRTSRESPTPDRAEIVRVLQERGLLCKLPESLTSKVQPLTPEELERLGNRAAQEGPASNSLLESAVVRCDGALFF